MYEADFLDTLLTCCKENNILCIADEVMTGFGRTGKFFACDHLKNEPDIICLSKGLTGGTMALGITTCKQKIYEAFLSEEKTKTFFHGHSFTANPVACAAAIASLELMNEPQTSESITRISQQHISFANKLKQYSQVQNIRNKGTILAFDIRTGENTSYFHSLRDELYDFFMREGIILRPLGNTLYIMPPYCITQNQLETIYKAIEKYLQLNTAKI